MVAGSIAEWGLVSFAAATAFFAWQSARSSARTEWLIGALESHSTIRLRMAAKQSGLKVFAYNPQAARYPARVPLVGEEWPLDAVYLAVPPEFRATGG
jgi:hypothetical protein